MTLSDAFDIAVSATAAGLLLFTVKRAALGDRPLLASVRCWVRDSHREKKLAQGGWRCEECEAVGADLGSVSPMALTYERKNGGQITREMR